MPTIPILLLAFAAANPSAQNEAANLSEFLRAGTPTFVLGTRGDDAADRAIRAQVHFVQEVLFPKADLVDDASLSVADGPSGWPDRPVLYGGAHLNEALAIAADCLPFAVGDGVIEIAGERYEGDEFRLIALVPASAQREDCPGTPQFALYAGAGTPGITEINATPDEGYGWLVADRFGLRDAGGWTTGEDGLRRAECTHRALRKPWRTRRVSAGEGSRPEVLVARLESVPSAAIEQDEDRAILRGVRRARGKLGIEDADPITVHVYPDAETKSRITRGGDGHADPASRTLHVRAFSAEEGGALERLIAHEATHVLANEAFGPPGSALWGEGLAVWVAGGYGGRPLLELRRDPPRVLAGVERLSGSTFRVTPERKSYPIAGLLVDDLVHEYGLDAFLEHLWPAGPDALERGCEALGITVERLDTLLRGYRER